MQNVERFASSLKRVLRVRTDSAVVRRVRPAYERLLAALYGKTGLVRSVDGEMPLRVMPACRSIDTTVEPAVIAALRAAIHPGSTVFDIGANVGLMSMIAGRRVGPTGMVVAFEPAPAARTLLHQNAALNGLTDRITVRDEAISDVTGTASFYAHERNGENSLSDAHRVRVPDATPLAVATITIDEFCDRHAMRPSVIKIDIEGFEIHALRGARDTVARHRPTIIVEMHPHLWPDVGESERSAAECLRSLGYRAQPLEGQPSPLSAHGHVRLDAA